jgi:SAM-dependent methyltransferase
MLRQAQQRLLHRRGCYRFSAVDAQAIPFQKGAFEAVIANHMLYHIPDMRLALSEIRRVLKPGGLLLAATNGLDHMQEIKTLVRMADPQATYSRADLSFRLENGGVLLEPLFSSVQLQRYEDALRVSEAAPLVDYILSMSDLRGISLEGSRLESFKKSIEQEIARQGAIHITKSACLFICRR